MPIHLDAKAWREIFPRAPKPVIDAFVANQAALDKVGITATKTRLAYALANVEHECGGFSIPNLTENINYSAARMADVWPNRFKSAADVQRRFGTRKDWRQKAFDAIYGGRMGNRPGTSDGSRYIGRGGPQITGRDGYAEVGKRCGLNLVAHPELASEPEHQPAILAAFWSWKNLNRFADAGDFKGCVKAWNGGQNGMADRLAKMKGNDPIIARLEAVERVAEKLPGGPTRPPAEPPHGKQSDEIRDVQTTLDRLGYHEVGQVDGKWGGRTAAAIAAFKNDRHLDGEPVIDQALIDDLLKAMKEKPPFKRPMAAARKDATAKDIAPDVKTVRETAWSRLVSKIMAIPAGLAAVIGFVIDNFDAARAKAQPILDAAGTVPLWAWALIVAGGAVLIWRSQRKAEQATVDLYRVGRLVS